jgi:hypothetical protein
MGKIMNYKKMVQEINKDWFENHVAEFEKLNDRVSILNWGKPGSCFYYTRYVFDGCKLYISGDVGEAVFCLTEKASIESIKDYSVDYFHGKLAAFGESEYDFDDKEAIKRLKEERKETTSKEYKKILTYLIDEVESCCNVDNWRYVTDQNWNDISEYDPDANEWIYEVGNVVPLRVQGYLIGIKMAYEQLNNKAVDA